MENALNLLGLNLTMKIQYLLKILLLIIKIEFDNVCFHYNPEYPILKNTSFSILPGHCWTIGSRTKSSLFWFYDDDHLYFMMKW